MNMCIFVNHGFPSFYIGKYVNCLLHGIFLLSGIYIYFFQRNQLKSYNDLECVVYKRNYIQELSVVYKIEICLVQFGEINFHAFE